MYTYLYISLSVYIYIYIYTHEGGGWAHVEAGGVPGSTHLRLLEPGGKPESMPWSKPTWFVAYSEVSLWSGWDFPSWCSGGRRPLIAGCISLQRLGVDLPVLRPVWNSNPRPPASEPILLPIELEEPLMAKADLLVVVLFTLSIPYRSLSLH